MKTSITEEEAPTEWPPSGSRMRLRMRLRMRMPMRWRLQSTCVRPRDRWVLTGAGVRARRGGVLFG